LEVLDIILFALPISNFQSQSEPFQCLNQLNKGARSILNHPLQSLLAPNILSACQYNSFITDNTVSWIKSYVYGPFDHPQFLVLGIVLVQEAPRHNKTGKILNLPIPLNFLFNYAICQTF
jgi:hypothetical protein